MQRSVLRWTQRFADLGVTLAGLSVQAVEEQRDFAARVGIGYRERL